MTTKPPSIAGADLALNRTMIRRERIRSGLSQKDVAERLEIDRSYLSCLESGRKQPAWSLLERMSKLWKVPVADLTVSAEAGKVAAKVRAAAKP